MRLRIESQAPRHSRLPALALWNRELTASGRGQDKRCRRRSAAIPRNRLSWGTVGKMWQHIAICGKLWQNMATCGNMCALTTNCVTTCKGLGHPWPFCENRVCPEPRPGAGEKRPLECQTCTLQRGGTRRRAFYMQAESGR